MSSESKVGRLPVGNPPASAPSAAGIQALPPEQLLAALVESSEDAIISRDLSGTILTWNPAAERLYGYVAAEAVGQNVRMLLPAGAEDEEPQLIERIKRGERMEHYETQRRCKDGRIVDVSLSISPIRDARGQVIGASKIARDMTDRNRFQSDRATQQEKELERLKQLNQFKSEFIGRAAHELRTPLLPIRIQIHLLSEALKSNSDPRLKRALEALGRNHDRLDRLVDDLLEAARVQSARLKLVFQPFDASELLDEAAESFHAVGQQLGISLVWKPKPGLVVRADPQRVLQVLHNLLGNAMKFTPSGGSVYLELRKQDSMAEIRVRDTGVGLAPEDFERLFLPFSQAGSAQRTEAPGTGLGLYISKGIVEQQGGRIWAESPGPGQGATFILQFPLSPLKREPLTVRSGSKEAWWRDAGPSSKVQRFKELI